MAIAILLYVQFENGKENEEAAAASSSEGKCQPLHISSAHYECYFSLIPLLLGQVLRGNKSVLTKSLLWGYQITRYVLQ